MNTTKYSLKADVTAIRYQSEADLPALIGALVERGHSFAYDKATHRLAYGYDAYTAAQNLEEGDFNVIEHDQYILFTEHDVDEVQFDPTGVVETFVPIQNDEETKKFILSLGFTEVRFADFCAMTRQPYLIAAGYGEDTVIEHEDGRVRFVRAESYTLRTFFDKVD